MSVSCSWLGALCLGLISSCSSSTSFAPGWTGLLISLSEIESFIDELETRNTDIEARI